MARAPADVTARTIKQLAQAKWQSSGLSDKHARRLKLRPLEAAEVNRLSPKFFEAGAMQIPYFTLDGKPTKFFRVRYLEKLPGAAGQVEKPQRYDQLPTMQEVYYPPLLKKSWKQIAEDTGIPVCITEGELKAACACAHGVPMAALGGVYSFMSSKKGVDLLPSLKEFRWKERSVYVVYDNDLALNVEVARAQRVLAERLLAEGAKIFFVSIPAGAEKGVDDYIVKHGVVQFATLIDKATPHAEGAALWKLNEEVVLIRNKDVVMERQSCLLMTPDQFTRHLYSNRFYMVQIEKGKGDKRHVVMEKAPLAPRWMEWEHRSELWDFTYEPGQSRIVDGNRWNLWNGWGVESQKGSVEQWEWLLDFLFEGDAKARKWFEQWCAYPIQYPGAKLFTAVILWSRVKRIGKSLMGTALQKIYGENAAFVNAKQLRSDFTSWAKNKQLVIGEEFTSGEKRHDADYIKDIITSPYFNINEKYKPDYTIPNHTNFLFFSNWCDSVALEDGDKRYLVHEIQRDKPAERSKYNWCDKWLHGDGPSYLRYHLERVNLSGFNPREHAPDTLSKYNMIRASKNDMGLRVLQMQEDPTTFLRSLGATVAASCDLYTADQLYRCCDPDNRTRNASSVANMGRALAAAGYHQVNGGTPVLTATGLHRLYAVRNAMRWDQSSRKEIKEHYDSHFGPQKAGEVK